MEAAELFENAMACLKENYGEFRFFKERDVVEQVEILINREIENSRLPYRVELEYSLLLSTRADLVIFNAFGSTEVAAEFKYEPTRDRRTDRGGDIRPTKFPVVDDWNNVEKDIQRIQQYVEEQKVKSAYSILVDEGGHFHWRKPFPGSEWIDWGHGRWVLWSQASRD